MRRVLTAAEMREADRITIEDRRVPGLVLMESAAAAVTRQLGEAVPELRHLRVLALCGKGNNGGDGLAVARQLLLLHPALDLTAVALAPPDAMSPDARANFRMLEAQDHSPRVVTTGREWRALLPEIAGSQLVLDAMLGTGLRGPARGLVAQVVADINSRFKAATVVAVDMPSGLGSDSGTLLGESVRADQTVTFTAPKVSQVLAPACGRVGRLKVARIGTADSVLDCLPGPRLLLSEKADARVFAQPRDPASHKGSYGHVVAVGGSRSKPGAILMAGTAALRAGAGLVTVATAAGACGAVVGATPELMLEPGEERSDGSLGPDSFGPHLLQGKSVVALGPGLGRAGHNLELATRICEEHPGPLVLDADGLAAYEEGRAPSRRGPTVLTPHPGEMARLAGADALTVQSSRLETARDLAVRTGTHVVLKGQRTLVASPDGDVVVNPTGTPGMATAGSGDILTGVIAAVLAQFPTEPVLNAVAAAVFLHGRAGELAARALGERSMLATDIAGHLAGAYLEVGA